MCGYSGAKAFLALSSILLRGMQGTGKEGVETSRWLALQSVMLLLSSSLGCDMPLPASVPGLFLLGSFSLSLLKDLFIYF